MKKALIKSGITVLFILLLFSINSLGQNKIEKQKKLKRTDKKEINILRPKNRLNQIENTNRNGIWNVEVNNQPDWYYFLSNQYNINLKVCISGNNCREGMGFTSGKLHLPYEERNKIFNFTWETDVPELEGVLWQVSDINFKRNSYELNPPGLLESGITDKFFIKDEFYQGSFSIDFSQLENHRKSLVKLPDVSDNRAAPLLKMKTPIAGISSYNLYQIKSKVYFVRIIPIKAGKCEFGSSEAIEMRFDNLPNEGEFEVIGTPPIDYPDIYNIQITDFTPIIFPTLPWGSAYITGIDEEKYSNSTLFWKQSRQNYEDFMNKNKPLLTEPYHGMGSEGWLESLWSAVNSAIDWVSNAYEWPKQKLAETFANLIDALPYIECKGDCQSYLETVIEAGMVYVGIPPQLPNAEELLNEGIDYIAAETATQLGCGAICEDQIKETLKEIGKEFTNSNVANLKNAAIAHDNGREPLFIPDYLNIIPAPEASIQPPVLYLELKKNNIHVEQKDSALLSNYYIEIDNLCINEEYYNGKKFRVPVNTDERDGNWFGEEQDYLELRSDPVARLWHYKRIEVPRLENNRSLRIPIYLRDVTYLFPGHLELVRQHGGFILYDDWSKMYANGKVSFNVKITVSDVEFWSGETYYRTLFSTKATFQLPNEYNGEYRRPNRIQ